MKKSVQKIREIVRDLEPGDVTTYGHVALHVYGHQSGARAVGQVISAASKNRTDEFPWWRVVYTDWIPRVPRQRERLKRDGIVFTPDLAVDWRHRVRLLGDISN